VVGILSGPVGSALALQVANSKKFARLLSVVMANEDRENLETLLYEFEEELLALLKNGISIGAVHCIVGALFRFDLKCARLFYGLSRFYCKPTKLCEFSKHDALPWEKRTVEHFCSQGKKNGDDFEKDVRREWNKPVEEFAKSRGIDVSKVSKKKKGNLRRGTKEYKDWLNQVRADAGQRAAPIFPKIMQFLGGPHFAVDNMHLKSGFVSGLLSVRNSVLRKYPENAGQTKKDAEANCVEKCEQALGVKRPQRGWTAKQYRQMISDEKTIETIFYDPTGKKGLKKADFDKMKEIISKLNEVLYSWDKPGKISHEECQELKRSSKQLGDLLNLHFPDETNKKKCLYVHYVVWHGHEIAHGNLACGCCQCTEAMCSHSKRCKPRHVLRGSKLKNKTIPEQLIRRSYTENSAIVWDNSPVTRKRTPKGSPILQGVCEDDGAVLQGVCEDDGAVLRDLEDQFDEDDPFYSDSEDEREGVGDDSDGGEVDGYDVDEDDEF